MLGVAPLGLASLGLAPLVLASQGPARDQPASGLGRKVIEIELMQYLWSVGVP